MHRHKYNKTKIIITSLIYLILLTCAPKPFMWQGRYAEISTTELPKEDIKVGNYLIVAYTPNEKTKTSPTLYKFAIMRDSEQIGLFSLEKIPSVGYLFIWEYLNKNRELIDDVEKYYMTERRSYITLELHRYPFTYEEIKNIIISEVANFEPMEFIDYNSEGDTIKILFGVNGKWNAVIKGNADCTYMLPALLKVNDCLTVYIKEDKTWEYVQPETLPLEYHSKSITIYPEKYKALPYENIEEKPQLIYSPPLLYPENLKRANIEGKCSIKMLVETDGSVLACKILKSSGYCEFDFSALCAGLKHKFTPAVQNNRAVRVWICRHFIFKLR